MICEILWNESKLWNYEMIKRRNVYSLRLVCIENSGGLSCNNKNLFRHRVARFTCGGKCCRHASFTILGHRFFVVSCLTSGLEQARWFCLRCTLHHPFATLTRFDGHGRNKSCHSATIRRCCPFTLLAALRVCGNATTTRNCTKHQQTTTNNFTAAISSHLTQRVCSTSCFLLKGTRPNQREVPLSLIQWRNLELRAKICC